MKIKNNIDLIQLEQILQKDHPLDYPTDDEITEMADYFKEENSLTIEPFPFE